MILWLQIGKLDSPKSHSDNLESVADALAANGIFEIDQWVVGGLEAGDLKGANKIVLFWGAKRYTYKVRDLNEHDRELLVDLLLLREDGTISV